MSEAKSQAPVDFNTPHVHVVPVGILLGVFAALMVLTLLTIAATYVDLGEVNIYLALGIAAIKASIVALYFMHLRYDRPFNGVILATAFMFVALFIGAVMDDTHAYQGNIGAPSPGAPAAP